MLVANGVVDSDVELQEFFNQTAHGARGAGVDGGKVRVRCKAAIRSRLLGNHMTTCRGAAFGCRLATEGYADVMAIEELPASVAAAVASALVAPASDRALAEPGSGLAAGAPPGAVLHRHPAQYRHTPGAHAPPPAADGAGPAYLVGVAPSGCDFNSVSVCSNLPAPGPHSNHNSVNRAAHKIAEAAVRSRLFSKALALPGAAEALAVDVGASPGGWTAFFAERCKQVLAVDSGALDAAVLERPNVVHIRQLLLEHDPDAATPSPAAAAAPAAATEGPAAHGADGGDAAVTQSAFHQIATAAAAHGGIRFAVCDINTLPIEAVRIMKRVVRLLADGAIVVVTMKIPKRRSAVRELDLFTDAQNEMATFCEELERLWLFSNTFCERTLVGRVSASAAAAKGNAAS